MKTEEDKKGFVLGSKMTFPFDMAILNVKLIWKSNEEAKMPIVHVHFWEGVGDEKVKTMIRGITKVIVDLGVPEAAVEVLVHEIPKTHWGIGGEPASEKLKDISPPK
jgi:4-oxalocrotonate tautomerase